MGKCLHTAVNVDLPDDDSYISESLSEESAGLQMKKPETYGKYFQNSFEDVTISKLEFSVNSAIRLSLSRQIYGSTTPFVSVSSSCKPLRKWSTYRQLPITEVTSQIYLGSFDNAKDDKNLKDLGISHIISLIGPKHLVEGIKHEHKPMSDYGRTDLMQVIHSLWPFIIESQEVGNKLFVHCQSGQNRSPTLVIAILMKLKYGSKKLIDLYSIVKQKRPIVQIVETYANQLSNLESELFGAKTMPTNWMSVESYCMVTGNVIFKGEWKEQSLETQSLENLTSQSHASHSNEVHNLGTNQYRFGSSSKDILEKDELCQPQGDKNPVPSYNYRDLSHFNNKLNSSKNAALGGKAYPADSFLESIKPRRTFSL